MAKFHILEVREGKGTFREVEGQAVEIEGVKAFVRNSRPQEHGEDWTVSDVLVGLRFGGPKGTKAEAIVDAHVRLLKCGVKFFREMQEEYVEEYGRSPSASDPEIKIIQEPQPPGDPETCEAICANPCTQRR